MTAGRRKVTWAVVADGAKALILVNDGTDAQPVMSVLAKAELENPPSHAQGIERPGRQSERGSGTRSAVEVTDWHELAEAGFLRDFTQRLNRAAEADRFGRLLLVAPPKVLGLLRPELGAATQARVVAEIGSDLTKHPVSEIERHIARAMSA